MFSFRENIQMATFPNFARVKKKKTTYHEGKRMGVEVVFPSAIFLNRTTECWRLEETSGGCLVQPPSQAGTPRGCERL